MSNTTRKTAAATTTAATGKVTIKSLDERLTKLEALVTYLAGNLEDGTVKLTPKASAAVKKATAPKAAKTTAKKAASKPERVVLTVEEREAMKVANKATAAWLRDNGIAVAGQAWAAAKAGERDVTKLKALNAADGLDAIVAVAKKTAVVSIDLDTPAKTVDTDALKAAGLTDAQIQQALELVG